MEVTFRPSGAGVDAQSIDASIPVCGGKSQPFLDQSTGYWGCEEPGVSGGGGGMLLLVAAAGLAYWWFVVRDSSAGEGGGL